MCAQRHDRSINKACLGAVFFLCLPSIANAAKGDFAMGLGGGVSYPLSALTQVTLDAGVTPLLSARIQTGVGLDTQRARLDASIGLVMALDVFTWVPQWHMGIGIADSSTGVVAKILSDVGARVFMDFDWSITVNIGIDWRITHTPTGTLMIAIWRHF